MIYRIKNKVRNLSHKYQAVNTLYSVMNSVKVTLLSNVSDATFAKIHYKQNTGRVLNLENPKTFNEKLWWLKINDRNPNLTMCSDKVEVRSYVKKCGLGHILNEVYGVYDYADEIDFNQIPEKAFIKTNHGSGTNILWDANEPFDKKKFVRVFNKSLKRNYYLQSREWNYKNINPKIIVEKVLEVKEHDMLIDYRFFCFDGKVKMVFVDIETTSKDGKHSPYAKRNVYNRDFEHMDIKVVRESFDNSIISKPTNYCKMVEYAEKLSSPFVFSRIDLYNIDGRIIFGEITFYPGGATQIVEPEEWENRMGDWIDINSDKIKLV